MNGIATLFKDVKTADGLTFLTLFSVKFKTLICPAVLVKK